MNNMIIDQDCIDSFISSISKGAFKKLQNGGSSKDVKDAFDKSKMPIKDEVTIYDCAVYQGYLDMCRTVSYNSKENSIKNKKSILFDDLKKLSNWISCYFKAEKAPLNMEDFDKQWWYGKFL